MNKDSVAEMSQPYQVEAAKKLVPKGYKQTEVGVTNSSGTNLNATCGGPQGGGMDSRRIPEDWEVVTLGTVGEIKMCKRIFKNQTKDVAEVPFYKIGTFGREPDAFISKELFDEYRSKYSYPKKGEILISAAGTIGRTVIFDGQPSYFQDSNIIWISNDEGEVLNSYLWHYYKVVKWSTSEGGIVSRLYNDNIRNNVFIAYPATTEQKEIAAALSDTEALVSELEKLIAKKQAIKTATMQQLLTGRTRLPQFANHPDGSKKGYKQSELGEIPEDWEVITFDQLKDRKDNWSITGGPFGSNLKSSDYTEAGVRVVQLQNIGDGVFKNNEYIYTSTKKANELISCNIYPGEIILSKMGDPVARACIIPDTEERYIMCSDGIRLKVDPEKFSASFIFFYLNYPTFRNQALEASTGSTRKRIGLSELRTLQVIAPSKKEQTAIATILSDMDEEIQALEHRLNKTRQIKQGMMQQLLTGKVRLV